MAVGNCHKQIQPLLNDKSTSNEKLIETLTTLIPYKSNARDTMINKMFNNKRFDTLDKSTQKQLLDSFLKKEKSFFLSQKYYDLNIDKTEKLDEKIELITSILDEPSIVRDEYLEKAIFNSEFNFQDLENKYIDLFSFKNLTRQTEEDSTGNLLDQLFDNDLAYELEERELQSPNAEEHQCSFEDQIDKIKEQGLGAEERKEKILLVRKMQTLAWMIDANETKPDYINGLEYLKQVKLNELKDMFKDIYSFRKDALENIFIGDEGLFQEKHKDLRTAFFDKFIRDKYYQEIPGDDKNNKLKDLIYSVFLDLFESEDEVKKMRVINTLFNKETIENDYGFEEMTAKILAAYEAPGVKLAQILSSQPSIEKKFPKFTEALANLKENANPCSMRSFLISLSTQPNIFALKDKIKFDKLLAAASMKTVFKISIDGIKKVLKVLKITSGKNLDQESQDLNRMFNTASKKLQEHFNVNYVPNYVDRILKDIKIESNLNNEMDFMLNMQKSLENFDSGDMKIQTATPDQSLSNSQIMVESFDDSPSLSKLEKDNNYSEEEAEKDNKLLSKLYAFMLNNVFHLDPHGGNIFKGEEHFRFIDLGLAEKMKEHKPPEKLLEFIQNEHNLDLLSSFSNEQIQDLLKIIQDKEVRDWLFNSEDLIKISNELKNSENILLNTFRKMITPKLSKIKNKKDFIMNVANNFSVKNLPNLIKKLNPSNVKNTLSDFNQARKNLLEINKSLPKPLKNYLSDSNQSELLKCNMLIKLLDLKGSLDQTGINSEIEKIIEAFADENYFEDLSEILTDISKEGVNQTNSKDLILKTSEVIDKVDAKKENGVNIPEFLPSLFLASSKIPKVISKIIQYPREFLENYAKYQALN